MLLSPNKSASFGTLIALAQTMIPSAVAGTVGAHRHAKLHARQYNGTPQGCFSSAGSGVTSAVYDKYQSSLNCINICDGQGYPVVALQGFNCYCAKALPSSSLAVSSTECDIICGGYGSEPCGGDSAYTIWLTGLSAPEGPVPSSSSVSQVPTSHSSTPSTTNTPKPSSHHSKSNKKHEHKAPGTISPVQSTVTKTHIQPGSTNSPDSQSAPSTSSTGSTIGIAVGVVAGIVAFAAVVTIILFYLRRRRRMKNAENGHRRADSLNAFVASGARTPGSLAGKVPPVSMNDARLDPRILHDTRRASGGSFLADNEDYSRRILKVTNPDGT